MANTLFNTSFEYSLHILMLLSVSKCPLSVERILAYDFMAVYARSFGLSEKSLHGENGFAFSELVARKAKISAAIKESVLEGLVIADNREEGTVYYLSNTGKQVDDQLQTQYAAQYRYLIIKADDRYHRYPDSSLIKIITTQATDTLRG